MANSIKVINGGCHTDQRGTLRFCNDFDMGAAKRFYTVCNSAEQPRRGWIMHKRETKWFFPIKGKTTVYVESDDVRSESDYPFYTLDAAEPSVLQVPPGNWFLIEQDGAAEVMVFSNCKAGEFPKDDFRRPI